MESTLVVIDTETTGLTAPIGVVEIAYIIVSEDLEVLEEKSHLVNPGRSIESGAQKIHGIADKDVADAITLEEALLPLKNLPIVAVGHNVQFDLRTTRQHLNVAGSLCTLSLSRRFYPESVNHKLGTMMQHCDLPSLGIHRALDDAHTSLSLLKHILEKFRLPIKTHIKWQTEPKMLHKMPWGMHKNKLVADVPKAYRDWLIKQPNLDQDLVYTLKRLENV